MKWRSDRGEMADSFLLIVAGFLGYTFFGVWLASHFADTTKQVIVIMAPITGALLGVVFVVILIRFYWNRRW